MTQPPSRQSDIYSFVVGCEPQNFVAIQIRVGNNSLMVRKEIGFAELEGCPVGPVDRWAGV